MTSAPTSSITRAATGGPRRSAPPGPLPTMSRRRAVVRRLMQGTPGRMRLFALLSVLAALAIGAVSANALLASRAAAERAANNTAQVVRVQSLHVDLLRADALATNAFLSGGLESADQRARYDAAISAAATGIAAAAAAQPADGRALGALADEVSTYTALVEQARANNRLGLPVGAQYLKEASAGLRSDAIPIVEAITTANEGRAQAEFDRSDSTAQLLLGVAAILLLLGGALWLARRTHRYLNGPLSAAIALLGAVLVVSAWAVGATAQTTAAVARGEYAAAVALADVSTAANDARANESLTLIARGSGAALERAWVADDKRVRAELSSADRAPLNGAWQLYAATHKQVRTLDDGGSWDQAVALATSTKADGAAARFAAFDQSAAAARDRASTDAIEQLEGLGAWTPVYTVVVGLAALLAAWLVVRGFGRRIEEYR